MLQRSPDKHNPVDDIADYLVGEFPHQVLAIRWKEKTPTFIVHHTLGVRHDGLITPNFLWKNGRCVDEIQRLCLSKVMRENRNQTVQFVVGHGKIRIKPRVTRSVAWRDGRYIDAACR